MTARSELAANKIAGQGIPSWVDRAEYPFENRWFAQPEGNMHYVDEGRGPAVVIVHGNPSWSFEHRLLIRHLARTHRVIAPDHLGFGLSDKPDGSCYLPQWHAANLARLLDQLALPSFSMVVHDWGGPIGMSYALENARRLDRLVVYNSWFWSLRGNRTFEIFSGLIGGPLGRLLCRRFNFFPSVLVPASMGDRSALSPAIHAHYKRPFPTPASRKGSWVFPRAIIGESEWLETLWGKRELVIDVPAFLLWGMKDKAFDSGLLARWQEALPRHRTMMFDDVGHMAPEELGTRALKHISEFLLPSEQKA